MCFSFPLFVCMCSYEPCCPSLVPHCLPLLWLWGWKAAVCMIASKPRDMSGNLRLIFLHLWTGADYYQLDPGLSVCTVVSICSRRGFHVAISLHFWFDYHKHLHWVLITLEKSKAASNSWSQGSFTKQEDHDSNFLLAYLFVEREVWERERNISNSGPCVSFLLIEMIQQIRWPFSWKRSWGWSQVMWAGRACVLLSCNGGCEELSYCFCHITLPLPTLHVRRLSLLSSLLFIPRAQAPIPPMLLFNFLGSRAWCLEAREKRKRYTASEKLIAYPYSFTNSFWPLSWDVALKFACKQEPGDGIRVKGAVDKGLFHCLKGQKAII